MYYRPITKERGREIVLSFIEETGVYFWHSQPYYDHGLNIIIPEMIEEGIIETFASFSNDFRYNHDYYLIKKGNPDNVGWYFIKDSFSYTGVRHVLCKKSLCQQPISQSTLARLA